MNVKIIIPTNLNDVTVGQFQNIDELSKGELIGVELDNEILKVILNFNEVESISVKDRNTLAKDIQEALLKDGEFQHKFKLNGVNYGLIPNFDSITNGEYTDLIKYADGIEDLHRFLAVAYRPIIKKDMFNNYLIEDYKGTSEHADAMRELPMSIAKGVQGFFLTLSNDLRNHILMSTEQELARV